MSDFHGMNNFHALAVKEWGQEDDISYRHKLIYAAWMLEEIAGKQEKGEPCLSYAIKGSFYFERLS